MGIYIYRDLVVYFPYNFLHSNAAKNIKHIPKEPSYGK